MKKRLIPWLSVLLAGTLLAGCTAEPAVTASSTDESGISSQTPISSAGSKPEGGSITENLSGPIVDEPITLTGFVYEHTSFNANHDEMPFWKEFSQETNINFEFERIPSAAWVEKLNLKLVSGKLPDFIGGCYSSVTADDIAKYGGKAFLDFAPLLQDNAPNLNAILKERADYAAYMTSLDGAMYGFPSFFTELEQNLGGFPMINQRWLNELNLPMPETLDDLYTTLKAFKEQDPNGNNLADEIPLSSMDKTLGSILSRCILGAYGLPYNPNYIHINDDGKVAFTPTSEGYKEGIKYLNKLYADGLLDQEIFTMDRATFVAKANQGREKQTVGVGFIGTAEQNFFGADSIDDYVPLLPVKGPDGDRGFTNQNASFMPNTFIITTANKYPAETVRMVDRLYSEQWSFQMFYGMFGDMRQESKDNPGKYELIAQPEGSTKNNYQSAPVSMPYYMPDSRIDKMLVPDPLTQTNTWDNCRAFMPYLIKPANPPVWPMTTEDSQAAAQLKVDISRLVDEKRAAWVTGSGNIDAEWDAYVSTLSSMKVDAYVQYYQASYDALNK